jgi:adenosine kinase
MSIVVTGSIAFDYLMSFPGRFTDHILPDQLDHVSLSFLVDDLQRRRGGAAANIAYNLALLHERPMLMGTVGQDFGGYRAALEAQGVDTSLVRDELDLFTASFFVNTDLDGNQIASFYTGAMARARQLSFHGLGTEDVDLVIISPNDPEAMVRYAAECQELRLPYLYDPSQQIVRLSAEELVAGLTGSSLLILNEYEFGMMQERTGMGGDAIRSAPSRACIVTLGAQGAEIWADGNRYAVPPVPPRRIDDPTGVGDAFRAGLIKGLSMGLPWDLAGRVGSLAATFTLEQPGAQEHHYTAREFVARFREHFDDGRLLDGMLH